MLMNTSFVTILREALPPQARRSIRRLLDETTLAPGGKGRLAGYLDGRATRRVRQAIIAKTHDAYTVRWLGRQVWQYPLDAWILQEVISEVKPDLIVETGTHLGGSAYFFGTLCDLLGRGEIISIDIAARGTIPHPRITYVKGSSIDPDIVDSVAQRIRELKAERVLIMLDSDHRAVHVRQELEAYAPLVPVGSYIHVQDGNMDELPCFRKVTYPGPMVAAKSFLKDNPNFMRDLEVELRYVMTDHPYGWLKRIAPDS
jgi:cephalosporin hydroxylase